MQADFWKGKSVLVTGHTGFKGSWLCLWLKQLGAQVTGFSLPPETSPNLFEAARVAEGMSSLYGDVRDPQAVAHAITQTAPDIVFHLAAQSLVRHSYAHPVDTYATNVMGTVHVLEAVRQQGNVAATLIVTSDKCYENREQGAFYREGDAIGGYDPYSSSKGCAELVTHAYLRSYPQQLHGVGSARAGNVIGGGDWAADRLVPDMMRALARNEAPVIRNPNAVRPWQHVLEPLAGVSRSGATLGNRRCPSYPSWNFAPSAEGHVNVATLAAALCRAYGSELQPVIHTDAAAVHEAHHLALDARKAQQDLHWRPALTVEQTLAFTAAWYRAHAAGEDMQAFSLHQLHAYQELSHAE